MAWVYLVLAGVLEIGWPLGLKYGWQMGGVRAWPLAGAIACMLGSGAFLFVAQRSIPMGTAYAVWTGIGAVGAFVAGIVLFKEPAQAARIVCMLLIVAGIIGMKLFTPTANTAEPGARARPPHAATAASATVPDSPRDTDAG